MEKIRNLSIKKTIVLYMFINLVVSFVLYYLIREIALDVQREIWYYYTNIWDWYARPSMEEISDIERMISELCDFLQTYGNLVISAVGTMITVCLFYKKKLQTPLKELHMASEAIAENNLECSVTYKNQDELGQLCKEFERMRSQLVENNKQMWRLVEQEKALRAAVAHDLRSPLAVLKGYQEMLMEYVPSEKISKEQLTDMLFESMRQIERMEVFLNTMRKLSKLEDREIQLKETRVEVLFQEIKRNVEILSKDGGLSCEFGCQTEKEWISIDTELVFEIVDNLVENSLRYAKSKVMVRLCIEGDECKIYVEDDGDGFSDSEEQLTKVWYHTNPQDDLKHFGLGLYICRMYCEKHGGRLLLGNHRGGGASAVAVFYLAERER